MSTSYTLVVAGQLLDKLSNHNALLFVTTIVFCICVSITAHCGNVAFFFANSTIIGTTNGILSASQILLYYSYYSIVGVVSARDIHLPTCILLPGLNTLCLATWRGRNSAPFMHLMHFFYSLGSLVAPVVAAPFLSEQSDTLKGAETDSAITTYYPLVGALNLIPVAGFFFLCLWTEGAIHKKKECQDAEVKKVPLQRNQSF